MKFLRIKKKSIELEINEKGKKDSVNVYITNNNDNYRTIMINLEQNHLKEIISFLQKQIVQPERLSEEDTPEDEDFGTLDFPDLITR